MRLISAPAMHFKFKPASAAQQNYFHYSCILFIGLGVLTIDCRQKQAEISALCD